MSTSAPSSIAAHANRGLDVDEQLHRLDDLAMGCPTPTLDGVCEHLFGVVGFQGDTEDYKHPRNSLLDVVLDRRRGIPITLSVVVMEVGRRLGLDLAGVGMPGHFLVRDRDDDDAFVDPFHQHRLDREGAEKLFTIIHGRRRPLRRALPRPGRPPGDHGPHRDQPAALLRGPRRPGRRCGRSASGSWCRA